MTKNLTEGSPAKLIFFFTMPLIAGNIFQQLYAFVDTLIVGRFLGVNALAAVGCTGALMFLMLGFVIGFSTGLSIYTGQGGWAAAPPGGGAPPRDPARGEPPLDPAARLLRRQDAEANA